MRGGSGNDEYWVDDIGDQVIETTSTSSSLIVWGSSDIVFGDEVYSTISYTLPKDVEELYLMAGATNGTGNDGKNIVAGNDVNNTLKGLDGDDELRGGAGADTMIGGTGDDIYWVDQAGDIVSEAAGEGTDHVYSRVDYTLGANVESLRLTGGAKDGTGNGLDNVIEGNDLYNRLSGGDGNDELWGNEGEDVLLGGNGNDRLIGDGRPWNFGADTLTGGAGADTFVFWQIADSTPADYDIITDFSSAQGDKIDLSEIDANSLVAGYQAFTFIGSQSFHGVAGELRVDGEFVSGDVNGDGNKDFHIKVEFPFAGPGPVSGVGSGPSSLVHLTINDFIL